MHVNPFACTRFSDKAVSVYECQTYRDELGVFALDDIKAPYARRYEEHHAAVTLSAVFRIVKRMRQMKYPLTLQLPIARNHSLCVQLRLGGKAFHRNLAIRHDDFSLAVGSHGRSHENLMWSTVHRKRSCKYPLVSRRLTVKEVL